MLELASQLEPTLLSTEKLPAYHAHHRAKHELLRRYMDVWLPKLGFTHAQVALIDGFASAGRYRDRQRGSPLIMLDAYVERCGGAGIKLCHTVREPCLVFEANLPDALRAVRGQPSRDRVWPRRDSGYSRWPLSLNLTERVVVRPGDDDYSANAPAPSARHAPNLQPASYVFVG